MQRVHYSFDYHDNDKVQQLLTIPSFPHTNIRPLEEWNLIHEKGEISVLRWINAWLPKADSLIVLIGEHTAENEMVKYEIQQAISRKIPLYGIHLANIPDSDGRRHDEGENPFLNCPNALEAPIYRPLRNSPLQSLKEILQRLNQF